MHIKSLTLRGFLSYKDATTITFDPRFNIIVGPNGSGKSTLLAGLRFVMGEAMPDKTHYLHQGMSAKALVGYVTIVFDNTDRRLTGFDQTEVSVRRDFSAKKDEMWLNGKRTTRQELLSTFEAAGFSRTNPYYFVHQHEVSVLTRMDNAERLKLFKEVAGTRVYDDRRAEASASLEETRSRRRVIDATLDAIVTRMKELKEEQRELQELLICEKEKKSIEYVLKEKELSSMTSQLSQLENAQESLGRRLDGKRSELAETLDTLDTVRRELAQHERDAVEAQHSLEDVTENITAVEHDITRLTLRINDRHQQAQRCHDMMKAKEEELDNVRHTIAETKEALQTLRPQLEAAEEAVRSEEAMLLKHRQELNDLVSRSGHLSSPTSRKKALSDDVSAKEQHLKQSQKLLEDTKRQLGEVEHQYQETSTRVEEKSKELTTLQSALAQLQHRLDQGVESPALQRKRLLLEELDTLRRQRRQDELVYRTATQRVQQTMRPSQLAANMAVLRWAQESGRTADVYGTFLDSIRVDPKYHTAVETAAGGQLFNLLVKNRHVAIDVIQYIKRAREGSTILTPLDEISTRETLRTYPETTSDVIPLVNVVTCKRAVQPALRQVLGRFLLVASAGMETQRANRLVSMDRYWENVSRKGLLSGGHRGHQTRLASHTAAQDAQERLHTAACREDVITAELKQLQDMEKRRFETEHHDRLERDALQLKEADLEEILRRLRQDTSRYETRRSALRRSLMALEGQIRNIKEEIQRMRRAITCPTEGGLTAAEKKRMTELTDTLADTEVRLQTKQHEIDRIHREVAEAETRLLQVLIPHAASLETSLSDLKRATNDGQSLIDEGADSASLLELEGDRDAKTRRLTQLEHEKETYHAALQTSRTALNALQKRLERLTSAEAKQKLHLVQLEAEDVQLKTQISEIRLKYEELNASKQTIAGSAQLIDDLSPLSPSQLSSRLAAVNKKLRSFEHVNRKALDQFTSFIDEETHLTKQRERLYKSEDAIVDLMQNLDAQKDATLLKTFENVNTQLGQVFSEIVPGGKAKLVLKKLSSDDAVHAEAEKQQQQLMLASESPARTADVFTGVGIKVQFPSFKGYIPLESLSGGQKSSVALALMFALQRVDPAPFYVLDEVDSSLDVQYRGAVASLIQRQARHTQIIVISHKPETIQAADWFLKTLMVNQTTSVSVTTQEDALRVSQQSAREDDTENRLPSKNVLQALTA